MDNYEIERARLERRRRVADAMMAQSMAPMGGTQMVSGIAVRNSPIEGIAKLLQAYSTSRERQAIDTDEQALQERQRNEIASAMGDYQRAVTPRPESMAGTSEPGDAPVLTPGYTPSAQDRQSAALTLMGKVGDPKDAAKLMVAEALRPPKLERVDRGDRIDVIDERGNVVQSLSKTATPDAVLREGGADRRHVVPSGSAVLSDNTTRRGQDMTDTRTREEGAANRNVTIRGQNMIDSRTREEGAMNRGVTTRGQDLTDARARELADQGKVTDAQRLAAGYADRMLAAEERLAGLTTGANAIDGKPGVIESSLATLPGASGRVASNLARSPERQQYRQAQEDWVRAKLRKESGAVIGAEEMDREIQTYFPQLGDTPEVIQQKAESRQLAAAGMSNTAANAPRAYSGPERRGMPSASAIEAEIERRRKGRGG